MIPILAAAFFMALPPTNDALNGFAMRSSLPSLSDRVTKIMRFPANPTDRFCYYIIGVNADAPVEFRNGNFLLNHDDFAGPEQGFNDIDAHGWPCQRLEQKETGVTYRVYRLANEMDAAIELTVVTEVIK